MFLYFQNSSFRVKFSLLNLTGLFLLIVGLGSGQPAQAQNWFPEGATWHYSAPEWSILVGDKILKVDGDTVILGIDCVIVRIDDRDTVFMYEENNRVHYYLESKNRFGLLYDLNANAGDTWQAEMEWDYDSLAIIRVDSVGTLIKNEDTLKVQYHTIIEGLWNWGGSRIIEKIGNDSYMFPIPGPADPADGPLRCYEDSQIGLLGFNGFGVPGAPCDSTWNPFIDAIDDSFSSDIGNFTLTPNPSNGVFKLEGELKLPEPHIQVDVVDIMGRKVYAKSIWADASVDETLNLSTLSDGMYTVRLKLSKKVLSKHVYLIR